MKETEKAMRPGSLINSIAGGEGAKGVRYKILGGVLVLTDQMIA